MIEKLVKTAVEINRLANHYKQGRNTAALRKLAMEQGVSKEDADAFIAGTRYCFKQIPVSQKNYQTSTEKLSEEMLVLKDPEFASVIGTYLLNQTKEDQELDQLILQPHKSLQRCMDYILEKAYQAALERAKKKGRDKIPERSGIGIAHTEVFAWANQYFYVDDLKKVQEKEKKEKEENRKSWEKISAETARSGVSHNKNATKKKEVSEKTDGNGCSTTKTKKSEESEQLSLFSF